MPTTMAVILLVLIGIGPNPSQPPANLPVEREEISRVVSSVIGWAKDKKLDVLYSAVANDDDYLSVSPGRGVVKAFADVKRNVPFWMSPDFQVRAARTAGPRDHLCADRPGRLVLLRPRRHQHVQGPAGLVGEHAMDRRRREARRQVGGGPAALLVRQRSVARTGWRDLSIRSKSASSDQTSACRGGNAPSVRASSRARRGREALHPARERRTAARRRNGSPPHTWPAFGPATS